tara:strand:+ start:59 stop:1015 length:957 start_codon:yes stop_codon:yes gene_type:complete
MKKIFRILVVISSTTFAQFAPIIGSEGCIAIPMDFPLFVAWADNGFVDRGWMNSADTTLGKVDFGVIEDCYGAPNPAVLSLGDGGSATFEFNKTLYNGEGFDFAVFENGFDDYFLELAFIEVSSNGVDFFRFEAQSLTSTENQLGAFGLLETKLIHNLAGKYSAQWGTPFDLDELIVHQNLNTNAISHIRIVDVVGSVIPEYASVDAFDRIINDPWPTVFSSGGFDLDAIGIIHQNTLDIIEYPKVAIFPNPVSISGVLRFQSNHLITNCKLINALGNVFPFPNSPEIRISDYFSAKGIYVLEYELLGTLHHQKILVR